MVVQKQFLFAYL